jgi:hypothetical protein
LPHTQGVHSDGQEIAVKRLSLGSRQGVQELKTELTVVARLQHKNLVRLKGFCLEEQEKLLVYEYMPKRSLDTIIFGTSFRSRCKKDSVYNIIVMSSKNLLFLEINTKKKH